MKDYETVHFCRISVLKKITFKGLRSHTVAGFGTTDIKGEGQPLTLSWKNDPLACKQIENHWYTGLVCYSESSVQVDNIAGDFMSQQTVNFLLFAVSAVMMLLKFKYCLQTGEQVTMVYISDSQSVRVAPTTISSRMHFKILAWEGKGPHV